VLEVKRNIAHEVVERHKVSLPAEPCPRGQINTRDDDRLRFFLISVHVLRSYHSP
jgi:hypothetical protein